MGAWGYGTFENDAALDWAEEFASDPSRRALSRTWDRIRRSGYIDADDAAAALAASEVVAAMVGKPSEALPAGLAKWAADNQLEPVIPDVRFVGEAAHAIMLISERSELKESIEESGGSEEWSAVINDLARRIGSLSDRILKK
jgi:Domain of unknown function (DUF4259)